MSYLKEVSIDYKDGTNLDAFGRLRVSDTGNRLDAEFTFDTLEEIFDEVKAGSGSIVHQANTRDVLLSVVATGTGDYAGLHSYPVPYTPGNSQLIDITAVLDNAAIGGGTAQLFLRTKISGSVAETIKDQADWDFPNNDIDWTFSQIFMIDFQSLKVGRIRYCLNRGGVATCVHAFENDNVRNSGYWQTPSLPAYWRIYNDATYTYMECGYGDTNNAVGFRYKIAKNVSATMKAICVTVKSEGGKALADMGGYPQSIDMGVTTKTVAASIIPLIAIRQRTTFNSLDNNSIAIPTSLTVQVNNPIRLIVIHDCSLTGAAWVSVDTDHSTIEYDVTASAYSNGHIIDSEYVATSKNIQASANKLLGKAVLWNRKSTETGILLVAAVRTTGTSSDTLVGIKWNEIR